MQFTHTEELVLPEKVELCSMIADHSNHVWISARTGNLYCYDMHTRQLLSLPDDLQSFHHAGAPLFCVCNAEGNVLLGIKGKGMMCYNPTTEQTYPIFSEEKLQGDTYAVLFDSHSNVWLSDKKNDFQFYAASRIFTTLSSMLAEMSDKDVRNIAIDSWGHLWIRGRNDLLCCDRKSGDVLFHERGVYNHLFIDSKGRLWTSEDRNTVRCYTLNASGHPTCVFQHEFSE